MDVAAAAPRPEGQARLLIPPRRETVAAVAVLDVSGVLATLVAATVLTLNDGTDRRWWWAVGLASALALFTTALLIRLARQRRSFIEATLHLAEQLEQVHPKEVPPELLQVAYARREAAVASGDLAIADRLTLFLVRAR